MSDPRDGRLLETFLDLARIDSPSLQEGDVAAYCEQALVAAGAAVHYDDSRGRTGSNVGNLIAELPGTAPGVLAYSAHMDCVQPCVGVEPILEAGVVRAAGNTVLGGDDKCGLAAIIEAVRRLAEDGGAYPTIRVWFSVSEETGLVGAKAMRPEDVKADLALVLDAAGKPGAIVVAAPTHLTFRAVFHGRASHAGVAPELGVSAIAMAAEAVTRMHLGRVDAESTANVGVIEGGSATNVVAPECLLTGECRSIDRHKVEAMRADMERVMLDAAERVGGSVEIEWRTEYVSYRNDPGSRNVAMVRAACADVGLESSTYITGGGSDANVIAELGVPVLALACGMENVHSVNETLAVSDLEAATRLIVAVARRMAAG